MRERDEVLNQLFHTRAGPAIYGNAECLDHLDSAGEERRLSSSMLSRAAGNF